MQRTALIFAVAGLVLGGWGCNPNAPMNTIYDHRIIDQPTNLPPTNQPTNPDRPSVNAPTEPGETKTARFSTAFSLALGASATFSDGLTVVLKAIDDSRCPEDVQCVWQGELSPVFGLSGGKVPGEPAELRLGTVRALDGEAGGYKIVLSEATTDTVKITVSVAPAKPATADASTKTGN